MFGRDGRDFTYGSGPTSELRRDEEPVEGRLRSTSMSSADPPGTLNANGHCVEVDEGVDITGERLVKGKWSDGGRDLSR